MSKAVEFLKAHQSEMPSRFVENAQWRRENRLWLQWSRSVAIGLIQYMETNGLSQKDLATRLDVSPQYVSRLLSGKVNFSFKSLAGLEGKLGLNVLEHLTVKDIH